MSESDGSTKVIFAAFAGNLAVAISKFVAAAFTGSSAMLSEGIHSVIDTGNQGLLYLGKRRAARPADDQHPFGYGAEVYFWSFVVAILIFAVGAGVSVYEGIHKLANPEEIKSYAWNYGVLAAAVVFEGISLVIGFREFRRAEGDGPLLRSLRRSKDPTVFTVLFEDSAAILGLLVAALGIFLVQMTGNPMFDGGASIIIGIILGLTALGLAIETKGLLIGEGASAETVQGIRDAIREEHVVRGINELRTLHIGPDDILAAISLDFRDDLAAGEVEDTISRLERRIKELDNEVSRVFIEVQSREDHQLDEQSASRQRASA